MILIIIIIVIIIIKTKHSSKLLQALSEEQDPSLWKCTLTLVKARCELLLQPLGRIELTLLRWSKQVCCFSRLPYQVSQLDSEVCYVT